MGRAQQDIALNAGVARAYGAHLLSSLGLQTTLHQFVEEHPAVSWTRSGMMALTGAPDGAPQMCPVPLTACADGALAALASLAPAGALDNLRGSNLLAERAAIAGFLRAGSVSPGGSCCLLEAADGWLAVNLTRDADWDLVPAWLEVEGEPDWNLVKRTVCEKSVSELTERARMLGLAVAPEKPEDRSYEWFRAEKRPLPDPLPQAGEGTLQSRALVVDLSSLWAGPLCSHLLHKLGADVVKVESTQRPDGARRGPAPFFDLMNARKRSVALDLATARGREQLRALISKADIVIEGSRPRALLQLGVDADALVAENPRLTWISITGYGRGEHENWIAFGDDAGVAAGLSRLMFQVTGQRLICGDAIADPMTGLHAALAAWAGYLGGGAGLVSLALRDVVRHCVQFDLPESIEALRERNGAWTAIALQAGPCMAPHARQTAGARALGADTATVFEELKISN